MSQIDYDYDYDNDNDNDSDSDSDSDSEGLDPYPSVSRRETTLWLADP